MLKNEYTIYSDKVDCDKDIMVVPELHYTEGLNLGKINRVSKMASDERPSHIIIPGDLYSADETTIFGRDMHLLAFLNYLCAVGPTFYIQGNSEINSKYLPRFFYNPTLFFSPLFYLLGEWQDGRYHHDEMAASYGINVIGLCLDKEIYELTDREKPDAIVDYYGDHLRKLETMLDRNVFNIFVCHDSMIGEALVKANMDTSILDLVITGRKHGGLYPDDLSTLLSMSSKYMEDAYPKYTAGMYEVPGLSPCMIVSSGITEYVGENKELESEHQGTVDFIRIRRK